MQKNVEIKYKIEQFFLNLNCDYFKTIISILIFYK